MKFKVRVEVKKDNVKVEVKKIVVVCCEQYLNMDEYVRDIMDTAILPLPLPKNQYPPEIIVSLTTVRFSITLSQ